MQYTHEMASNMRNIVAETRHFPDEVTKLQDTGLRITNRALESYRRNTQKTPNAKENMSIVLEQLTKRYAGHPVVNRLSLEIANGEFFVLIGPSGSGKSTVLRMIAGLNTVDEGRVILHNRDVTLATPQQRGVGFVFQHYALFQHMSVADNIEFALRVRQVPVEQRQKRRDELLELVGLAGLGGRLPDQLSGGQQQRVALARALATNQRFCCSMSRSARWTRRSASNCAARSGISKPNWESQLSLSRTIRKRRSSWQTVWE